MNQNYNPFSLEGKTILITGASSGIGRATAVECAQLGAKVIITGRNQTRLEETISLLEGDGHTHYICDLAKLEEINGLVEQLPQLSGVVSNAGTNKIGPIQFFKEEVIQDIFTVNTISPMLLLKQLLKKKKLIKDASVVFTSSIAGLGAAATGAGIYTASKGAISTFIKVAALELAPRNIRVNAVCPGMTNTHMIYDESAETEQIRNAAEQYPLKRFGEPKEIAWGIVYLLSDASSWITGTNLVIDGGLTIV